LSTIRHPRVVPSPHVPRRAALDGMIRYALEGARGKNFINPAPRLDESIA